MMLAGEFARLMDLELLTPEMAERPVEIKGCYIGDLLSNVMGKAEGGQIWFTVMTNVNIVAVAQLLGLAGIVLLEGFQPGDGVLEKAVREEIPVFASGKTAYEAAIGFYKKCFAG